jgi:hypothetical protein
MSIYRSYFAKNNTLIEGNQTNNSQNPVSEISYGTPDKLKSRLIFKVDLTGLSNMLSSSGIPMSNIVSHKLHLTNTIAFRPDLLGSKSYLEIIDRASSFQLDLFTVREDWDEGAGYSFIYRDQNIIELNVITGASNWYQKKTNLAWTNAGGFLTGGTGASVVLTTQTFPKGNEDVDMVVTNYINNVLFSGATDHGLGLKFSNAQEDQSTTFRKAVGFHIKNTNTVFEPYIETIINDSIRDDRKYFFMDKQNELYLYSSAGDVTISAVTITDYQGQTVATITGTSIVRVKKGVYKIVYSVDSTTYPDAVIFNDNWVIIQNGKLKTITQDFYLISADRYFNFDLSNGINSENFHFTYFGLKSGEVIKRGDVRRVQIIAKQLYSTQDDNFPLDLSYRLFMKQGGNSQLDIIPFTQVNRTIRGYEFDLDTSWLIPHDYTLELKLTSGGISTTKSPITFSITNDDIFAN